MLADAFPAVAAPIPGAPGTVTVGVEGVAVARFTAGDVVRHPLVERIVRAYEAEKPHEGR